MRTILSCIPLLAFPLNQANAAEAQMSGGVFVPIKSVIASSIEGKCIDVNKYYVSINVAQLQMQRSASWISRLFSTSKALGAKVDVSLRREGDASASPPFSRSINLNAKKVSNTLFLAPVKNVAAMEKYDLAPNGDKPYVGMGVAFSFVQTDQSSSEFKVFQSLVSFSQSLSLPPNPYQDGLALVGKLTQNIFSANVADGQVGDPDALFDATLATDQAQADDAGCAASGLTAGAQAVVFPYDGDSAGLNVLPVDKLGDYCFWRPNAVARVTFAKRTDTCAAAPPANAVALDNPLIVFAVNPWRKPAAITLNQPIASIPTTKGGTATVTMGDITSFLSAGGNKSALFGARVDKIASLAQALIGKSTLSASALRETLQTSSSVEQEAALALSRCKAIGIEAQDCR